MFPVVAAPAARHSIAAGSWRDTADVVHEITTARARGPGLARRAGYMDSFAFSLWPPGSRANDGAEVFRCPWSQFASWLAQPLDTDDKHRQAFSPLIGILPGKGGRIAGGDAQFLALEYDDSASPAAWDRAQRVLGDRQVAAVLYTTASATPERPRFRVVMPTTRTLDDAAYASCVDHFGVLVGVRPSPESRQRTRLWYRPIRGSVVVQLSGGPWDVDASLTACPPPPPRLPPPAPSADALASWPLAERVRQAWARMVSRQPAGAFAAGCVCHDHGVPEDIARLLVMAWAHQAGWAFDDAALAERVEHAYEYARDPFGCQLLPSVLTHPDLRERMAGVGR